jgi:hypothetical protein
MVREHFIFTLGLFYGWFDGVCLSLGILCQEVTVNEWLFFYPH